MISKSIKLADFGNFLSLKVPYFQGKVHYFAIFFNEENVTIFGTKTCSPMQNGLEKTFLVLNIGK